MHVKLPEFAHVLLDTSVLIDASKNGPEYEELLDVLVDNALNMIDGGVYYSEFGWDK